MYERIRNLREDRDLSQKTIADYLGCSQVAYSYYEIGKRALPVDLLCKLAAKNVERQKIMLSTIRTKKISTIRLRFFY